MKKQRSSSTIYMKKTKLYKEERMNYVGVDYHKRYSVATVMDQNGVILATKTLDNRIDAFRAFLKPFGKAKAAVEATRGWAIAVEILEQLLDEVVLAHPGGVKTMAQHKFKTDKIDSRILAKLLQIDWLPEAYLRDRVNREQQLILRTRCFFVRLRTRVKNRIHELIDRQAEPIREHARTFSDLFGKKGLTWLKNLSLNEPYQTLLSRLLTTHESLDEQVKGSDDLVAELFKTDPDCPLVASVPGFGPFFSVLTKVEIGDIKRFPNSSRLCSYAGLVPSTESSGGKTWHGSTIKQSNHWLRWAFIEAVIPAIVADDGLRAYYEQYRRIKGTKIAKVITGRRLCGIVYRILSQKTPYYEQTPQGRGYLRAG